MLIGDETEVVKLGGFDDFAFDIRFGPRMVHSNRQ
jgi:hypothetical protein